MTHDERLTSIVRLWDSGAAGVDMGSLTYRDSPDNVFDNNSAARFTMLGRFIMSSFRAHFTKGTLKAPLAINLDSGIDSLYDTVLKTLTDNVGTGSDVHFRVPFDEHQHWIFDGGDGSKDGDEIVLTRTAPDATGTWAVEMFLIPVPPEEN